MHTIDYGRDCIIYIKLNTRCLELIWLRYELSWISVVCMEVQLSQTANTWFNTLPVTFLFLSIEHQHSFYTIEDFSGYGSRHGVCLQFFACANCQQLQQTWCMQNCRSILQVTTLLEGCRVPNFIYYGAPILMLDAHKRARTQTITWGIKQSETVNATIWCTVNVNLFTEPIISNN